MSTEKAMHRGKYRWRDVRDERAGVGDGVHSTIESEHKGLWDFPTLDEEQKLIMAQWEDLKKVHDIRPVETELTVWEPGSHAGTLDGLWYIDGILRLVDVKTSKNHWPGHDYQLAGLAYAEKALVETVPNADPKNEDHWKEVDNPAHWSKIDGASIIHLRADKWAIIPVPNLAENYEIFKAYARVWWAKQNLKEKEDGK